MPKQLSEEQLNKLRSVDSPTISNIILMFNRQSVAAGFTNHTIKCCYPDLPPTVGYAVTTTWRCAYDPMLRTSEGNAYRALQEADNVPKPFIMVKQDLDTVPAGALYGEMYVRIMKAFGCSGIITNGAGRDYEQVRQLEFPCFTSCMLVGRAYSKTIDVGVSVQMGGLTIQPGDLLHADANGVVLVPEKIAEAVVECIDPYLAAEQTYIDYASGDNVTLEGIGTAYEHMNGIIGELKKKAQSTV